MDHQTSTEAFFNNQAEDYNEGGGHKSFDKAYLCFPLSYMYKYHLENGNRIIMPASALHSLVSMELEEFPMLFKITNPSLGRVSHCGVLEFSAEEGSVFIPNWMMNNLKLKPGQLVNIQNASLPKATYMKLQPHSIKFITSLSDAKDVLERILKDFCCLTTGDTIMIDHEDQNYHIDIAEAKPNMAISLFETDCKVDFAQPLDYKEPKPNVEIKPPQEEDTVFKPFTGNARRLDGRPWVPPSALEKESSAANKREKLATESKSSSRKRAGRVVFGADDGTRPMKKLSTKVLEDVKEKSEKNEDNKFQAFTGKKYTLSG